MSESTVIQPIGDALAAVLEDLEGTRSTDTWAPRETGARPAAVVELPSIRRSELDRAEDHLGEDDWSHTFWVVFYFDLAVKKPQLTQAKAAEIVESWIKAIDANPTLGLDGLVQEAKVVATEEPEFAEGESKPVMRWRTRVGVLAFV